jgi:hypothetical protein
MTLPLSKKHQTTRANTRRWSRLKLAVLGASVLWNLAPLASADQPGLRTRDTSASQPAAARWKKLKGQYEVTPSSSTRSTQLEQPNGKGAAVKATPVSTAAEPLPAEVESTFASEEQAPERALPLPEAEPSAKPYEESVNPFEDPAPVERSVPAQSVSQLDQKTQEKMQIQTPMDPVGAPRPNARPIGQGQIQGGPPRKTTQVRRISDINPQNDFDRDTEIKQYAAEKAREFNVRFGGDTYTPRNFPDLGMCWTPPHTQYYPLYFEDPALERYGHTHHHLIQPIISSARMSGQLVMMPYQMVMVPPWELHSPLGWYRPGDVVPKLHYPFPWNTKAALVQAAAVTGFIYVIP